MDIFLFTKKKSVLVIYTSTPVKDEIYFFENRSEFIDYFKCLI
jgi:hypothetical protein